MPCATSASSRACVADWPPCVSKPDSVTRTTATPPGLAMTWLAVLIALPNPVPGNSVVNA